MFVAGLSTTSILLQFSVIEGVEPSGYTIIYSNTNTQCFSDSGTLPITDASAEDYNIVGLQEGTEYTITVILARTDGLSDRDTVRPTTDDDGKLWTHGIAILQVHCIIMSNIAPSAPPTSVSVYEVTSSSITVQWGPVDCIHRNGDITGYSVRYREVGSAERERTVDEMVSGDFSGGMYTISGLSAATQYTVEVAAETSAGTGPYSQPENIETPDSECAAIYMWIYFTVAFFVDVYLSLNDRVIPNHGYVVISDIGTAGDDTALLCHTNRPPPTGSSHSRGDWFAPDGTTVDRNDVPGFRRNRSPMVVRLYRNTATGPPAEGIYYCQIQDDTNTLHIVTVGIYNSTRGM